MWLTRHLTAIHQPKHRGCWPAWIKINTKIKMAGLEKVNKKKSVPVIATFLYSKHSLESIHMSDLTLGYDILISTVIT